MPMVLYRLSPHPTARKVPDAVSSARAAVRFLASRPHAVYPPHTSTPDAGRSGRTSALLSGRLERGGKGPHCR